MSKSNFFTAAILGIILSFVDKAYGAEGSFDVFRAATLSEGGLQYYSTHNYQVRNKLYDGNKHISNPQRLEKTDLRQTFGINYSFKRNYQLGVFTSYIDRKYRLSDTLQGHVSGMGDSTLYIKHMFHKDTWKRGSFKSSITLGVDLPSAKHDAHKGGTRLPDSYQLGNGSVNTTVALSTGWEQHKFGISGMALHHARPTGAHHYNPGNITRLGMTMKYRFWQQPFPGGSANLRWGTTYQHEEKARKRSRPVRNNGGHHWMGKVGVVYHPKPEYDITVFFKKHLKHRMHGTQVMMRHSLDLALGYRF